MPSVTFKESAAATTVGTDIFDGNKHQVSSKWRRVTHIGVVGSTNPGDAAVELFYGARSQGTFYNTQGGANLIPNVDDLAPVGGGQRCQPNEPIRVEINDASAGNVLAVTLVIHEYSAKGGLRRAAKTYYPRRRYNYRRY
jgi:hypothetical protein